MKLGETINHNGVEAILVRTADMDCRECCFNGLDCPKNGLIQLCLAKTKKDDDGIFKQVEPKEKEKTK